nr:inositol-3-phosphate synthase [Streptomyces taklimakanensis]
MWDTLGGRGAVGVWLVGARGSTGTTTIVGALALRAGLVRPTGCVTARRDFASASLPRFDELVFGGHDIARTPLAERAERLADEGVVPPGLPRLVRDGLLAAEEEVRPGATGADDDRDRPSGENGRDRKNRGTQEDREDREDQEETIRRLTGDLLSFRRRLGLERVVVIDLAPPGPAAPPHPAHLSSSTLRRALAAGERILPSGALYACAALRADCSYVDLTTPPGRRLPALAELASERGVPYVAGDGATGARAHHVRRPARERVSAEDFPGARTARRSDRWSREPAPAASLVIDLARLVALADRAGLHGPVPEPALLFDGTAPDASADRAGPPGGRYAALVAWARGLSVPV